MLLWAFKSGASRSIKTAFLMVMFGLLDTPIILFWLIHPLIVTLFEMTKVLPPTADSKPLILPETFVTTELSSSYRFDCIIKLKNPIGVEFVLEF